MSLQDKISLILNFWFGEPDSAGYGEPKDFWFLSTPKLDQQIRHQFEPSYEKAIAGELDALLETPEGSLALIILLDQFPRNMYRGTPKSFASDSKALEVAEEALKKKLDQRLLPIQKMFLYLPLEHSEDLANQEKSVQLFKALGNDITLKYAIDHRDIIARFGRFPHRNAILGRESTLDEIEFLKTNNGF